MIPFFRWVPVVLERRRFDSLSAEGMGDSGSSVPRVGPRYLVSGGSVELDPKDFQIELDCGQVRK